MRLPLPRRAWTLRVLSKRLFCLALPLSLAACGGYTHTTRIVNGSVVTGRPVAPQAYALYFEASAAEARGELRRARDLYLAAEENDANSPELWTRIGALSCKIRLAMADAEIRAALELDPWYAPAWRERARCELSRRRFERALIFARRAQVADPSDFQTATLLADIHVKRRAMRAAEAQLVAYALSYPRNQKAWRVLHEFASQNELEHWERYAARRLNQHASAQPSQGGLSCVERSLSDCASVVRDVQQAELVDAILADDLAEAQRYATTLRLPQVRLVALLLKFGKPTLALRLAKLLIAAGPHDSEVRVWGLLAAHRAGDDVLFARWLMLPEAMTGLDATTAEALETLVHERLATDISKWER